MSDWQAEFITPAYGGRCFADLPQSIYSLLTGDGALALASETLGSSPRRPQKVIFLLVDAFGWAFFERFREEFPALERFDRDGHVAQLTSQFPSTTAAHVTAIHTGLPVGQSGVYEWHYHEPKVGALIAPLRFSFAGSQLPDSLQLTRVDPRDLFPTKTLYHRLAEKDVQSRVFQSQAYTPSTYSDVVCAGSEYRPFQLVGEGLTQLAETVQRDSGPAYYYFYYDAIDSIGHRYGPGSKEFEKQVASFFTEFEQCFFEKLGAGCTDTLLMVTADHGMMAINPQTTIYLNRDPRFADLIPMLQRHDDGSPWLPAGSSRDLFLHVEEQRLPDATELLARELDGVAVVVTTEELIQRGVFGLEPVSEVFRSRVGNLVLLPLDQQSMYWYEKGRFEQLFYGQHGGLTPTEMQIPLLTLAL